MLQRNWTPEIFHLSRVEKPNNGLVGKYNIAQEKTFERCLTVAYNGSWPLLTKYHPYRFGAKE